MSKKFSIKQPITDSVLDVSTGHITEKDAALLEVSTSPLVAYPFGPREESYGYMVYLNSDKKEFEVALKSAKEFGFSKQFINICRWARLKLHCTFVKFDRDGALYDLPTFNW